MWLTDNYISRIPIDRAGRNRVESVKKRQTVGSAAGRVKLEE
jgi:hypothetical protein